MSVGGAVLRFGGLFLRILQFCCAGVALGIFSYFLSVLADRDLPIATWKKAVEGLTGAAVIYTIFAILLVLFLGGKTFFGFLAVVLDLLFVGAFVAVAWFTRHGASSCSGNVQTPLGNGPTNSNSPGYGNDGFGFGNGENSTYFPNLGTACKLNTAVFAVSIIAIFLFLVSAIWQILMVRHHKKEKRYGPGPNNNYTKGSGKTPFWKRGRKAHNTRDAEAATTGTAMHHTRPSHETGTTIGNNAYRTEPSNTYGNTEPKYGEPGYGDNSDMGYTNPNAGYERNLPAHGQAPVYDTVTSSNRGTF